jgi:hypothetical protein
MRLLRALYPLLFAILPPLHIAVQNPGRTSMYDLLLVIGTLLCGFGLVYLLVFWALNNVTQRSLVRIVVLAVVIWFYSIALARFIPWPVSHVTILTVTLLTTGTALIWLSRHKRVVHWLNGVLSMTGTLLVGWSALQIGISVVRERRALTSSKLVEELRTVPGVSHVTGEASWKPTIYLVVLDEYANAGILQEQFGFSNREFEDSLRQLGFTIPKLVRSNYAHTTLSLASLLNFTQLTTLSKDLGSRANDPSVVDHLVANNRTARFLKAQGYHFILFPSEWWPATAHSLLADLEFRVWHDLDLRHALARTELRRHLWNRSLLRAIGSPDMFDPEYLQRTFEGLRQLDRQGKPTFIFAHFILPHTPYVFDAQCRPRTAPDKRDRRLYLDQLRCTNTLVLNLVTTLLRQPGPPPVILLQGDHGTAMLDFNSALNARSVTSAQARERFGAFGAYFLPGGGGRLFADTITLVNVFPKTLDFYFTTDIPLVHDDVYMSLDRAPFDFAPVDPHRIEQGAETQ